MSATVSDDKPKRRLAVLLPLVFFLALAALFFFRLGSGDPSRIPSALIGHPAPETNMPARSPTSWSGRSPRRTFKAC
jgi:cytochrome c biogenesis protein CcmG/thiol:disulfide interchange protein DsbE